MSVRFYDKNEHGANFVGFRVSREIYGNPTIRQKYFSLNDYSYATAYSLAHELDKEWKLESEHQKTQKRASTNKIRSDALAFSINSLANISLAANAVRIRSTQQLSVFLKCASQEGNCLYDIFGIATDTPEYKNLCGKVRQLMLGNSSRGNNGADLLTWGELVYGKEREVVLTTDGYKFYCKIKNMLERGDK